MKITDWDKTYMKLEILQERYRGINEIGDLPSDRDAKETFKTVAKAYGKTTNDLIKSFRERGKNNLRSDFPCLADRRVFSFPFMDGLMVFGEKRNVYFMPNEDESGLTYALNDMSKERFKKAFDGYDVIPIPDPEDEEALIPFN